MVAARSRQVEYARLNNKYLREADNLLAKKDYPQASKKLWGATAEIIKAVAAKTGLRLGTHRSLGEFIVKLQKEHPNWQLIRAFDAANSLHMNFYEDWLPSEIVEEDAKVIRDFVHKLKTLL